MKTSERFGREILLKKIDNKNYKIEFTSTQQFAGVVTYQAIYGGGNFKGIYEIFEDGLLNEVFITLSIPNVQFIFLKDGDLKSVNAVLCEASKFYDLMENEFHSLKGN